MGMYSHKVIFKSKNGTSTLRVGKRDSYSENMIKLKDLFNLSHTVTVQEYPIGENEIVFLKKVERLEKKAKVK